MIGRNRTFGQRGTVLLGVIVLAALLLIGTATIGVIYVRQLNQQRQILTHQFLETAFHGVFPGNERKVANNLFDDFGYSPAIPTTGGPPLNFHQLRALTSRGAIGSSDPNHVGVLQFSGTPTNTSFNAWNGPYWTGPVDGQNNPVDAWGRPMQLRYISTSTPAGWQVFSSGANGVAETGDSGTPSGDDQVFPTVPYPLPASNISVPGFSLQISVSALGPGNNHWISVFVTDATGTTQIPGPGGSLNYQMHSNGSGGKPSSGSWSQAVTVATPPGTVTVDIRDSGVSITGWPKTYTITAATPMPLSISLP